MSRIDSKAQMYEYLQRGLFGNHFPWMPFIEWLGHNEQERCAHIHSIRFGRQLGAPWSYNLLADDVFRVVCQKRNCCRIEDISVVVMPIGLKPLCQGEGMRAEYGLELHYSTYPAVMRRALATEPRSATGLVAQAVLDHYADPASVDCIMELLDIYDGAVVEFSVYDRDVGCLPHRNTVIWEVRHY